MAWAVAFSRCKNCRAMAKASKNVSSAWKAVSPVVNKVWCLTSALRESPSRADTREALIVTPLWFVLLAAGWFFAGKKRLAK